MEELEIVKDVKNEITYDKKGEGYISQRGVARLIGVAQSTVNAHINKGSITYKRNENNQLHEGSLMDLLRSIGNNNSQVLEIVKQIETMGVRTVFHGVVQPQQCDSIAIMRSMLDDLEIHRTEVRRLDLVKAEQADLERLENSLRGTNCPKGYMPSYKLAEFLDTQFNTSFKNVLKDVRFVKYPFTNGNGNGLQPRLATGYHIEDVRIIIEG
jgi:predicted transcriptional regulator